MSSAIHPRVAPSSDIERVTPRARRVMILRSCRAPQFASAVRTARRRHPDAEIVALSHRGHRPSLSAADVDRVIEIPGQRFGVFRMAPWTLAGLWTEHFDEIVVPQMSARPDAHINLYWLVGLLRSSGVLIQAGGTVRSFGRHEFLRYALRLSLGRATAPHATVSTISEDVLGGMAKDDALLMSLFTRNGEYSKSLTLNFLQYYTFFNRLLERHGVERPASTLELGAGERPYTALRFLLEGATRCAVNDIAPMKGFTPQFLDHLRTFVDLVWPGSGARLDRLRMSPDAQGMVPVKGLEVVDGRGFETLDIRGDFDLVYSVSVLEHVMDPSGVVARIWHLLKPGGYACHSIDLRDHADFADPLGFLRLTEDEYALNKTENRLRASDWFALFEQCGFTPVGREFVAYRSAQDHHNLYSETPPANPWVTDSMRQGFASPFDTKDLADLSTVSVRVLYRKPL